MESRAFFYCIAMVAGLIAAVGDGLLNKWAKSSKDLYFVFGGFLSWNAALVLFTWMLKKEMLAQVVVIFLIANYIAVIPMSQWVFHESISTQKWIGFAIALLAMIIIETG